MSGTVNDMLSRLAGLFALGGPVVLLLVGLSVIALAVVVYKLWQHATARVGRHVRLRAALAAHDRGDGATAQDLCATSRSHLAPLAIAAMAAPGDAALLARLEKEAESNLARLEGGFRVLDSIAQVAPLLGLFGTVLGMIDAFRALQDAGSAVDPSLLAGGIWVALLTTAAGLAAHDRGDGATAQDLCATSRSHLAPLAIAAMAAPGDAALLARLEKEAESNLARLEGGFRVLDSIAQVAPLLGLFGTVLGMIDAFRALQDAGSAVDPSLLAGGIWVALLTTAAGLAVAMPTSLALAWLESRTARERDFAELVLARIGRAVAPARQDAHSGLVAANA